MKATSTSFALQELNQHHGEPMTPTPPPTIAAPTPRQSAVPSRASSPGKHGKAGLANQTDNIVFFGLFALKVNSELMYILNLFCKFLDRSLYSFGIIIFLEILKDEKSDDELLRKALARIESLEKQLSSKASEAGSVGDEHDGDDKDPKKKKGDDEEDPPIVTPDGVKVS